jgi:hypothetical protein
MLLLLLITVTKDQAQSPRSGMQGGRSELSSVSSTYVPIENWVYPAIGYLASTGYIQTAFVGLRPWTRTTCASLVAEAQKAQATLRGEEHADSLIKELAVEFAPELRRLRGDRNGELGVESIDFRNSPIAGAPLTDGYHTAQTITNDYGRPYGQGENLYVGASVRAVVGPFSGYLRAELQQSAQAPPVPSSADAAIAAADFTTAAALGPASGFLRGRVLEGYLSYEYRNNQITFGKQALWWGPGQGGPMLFSNNAEPLTMLRYDRVRPFELPGPGRWLGPIRLQVFVGRLGGQQFIHTSSQIVGQPGVAYRDQPYLHGQKVSFKPTPNFEFSVSRTTIFAGNGSPFTTRSFLRSLFSVSTSNGANDPGDRRSAVDMQYRIPKLRNWLTAYVDTFTDDEPFPLNYPKESAWSPGFYLTHIPKLARVDLRAEGYLTPRRDLFPGFYYFNVHYLSGYTNERQLIGSWIGRESDGLQIWSDYRLSPRSTLQASFRHVTENREFLRGGDLTDLRLAADIAVRPEWQMHIEAQEERWRFPLLSTTPNHNVTATVQLSYRPSARTF